MKVGGGLEFDGGTTISGAVGLGKDEGLFGQVGAGVISYGHGAGSQVFIAGGLGKELSNKLGDKIAICPIANAAYGFKKDGYSWFDATAGLSGGYPLASSSENMQIILTGAGQLGFSHGSVEGFGGSTDFVGVIDAGVGLVFNNRISLVPALRIYFGNGSDVAFAVRASVALGH